MHDPSIKIIDKNLIEVKRKYDLAEVRLKPHSEQRNTVKQSEEVNKLAKNIDKIVDEQNIFMKFVKDALDNIGD